MATSTVEVVSMAPTVENLVTGSVGIRTAAAVQGTVSCMFDYYSRAPVNEVLGVQVHFFQSYNEVRPPQGMFQTTQTTRLLDLGIWN